MSNPATAISLSEFCSKVDEEGYLRLGKELSTEDVGKSFSLLSFGLTLSSNKREEYYKLYLKVVERWSSKLIEASRYQDVLKIFEAALAIYPQSADINYLLACTLYRIGKLREAWEYSVNVLSICENDPRARDLASSLANSLVDRWHFPMINDCHRNKKFKDAIENMVQRGHTSVLDIGAGSALLSIYASRAGSQKTYACEVNEFMAELASSVLTLNSCHEKVVLLNKHSKDLQVPADLSERVSLVVTETFDAGLFGEHILPTLKHAWEQLLLPNPKTAENPSQALARVVPSRAEIWIAIIECNYIARQTKMMRNCKFLKDVNVRLHLDEPYLSEKISCIPGKYKLLTKWENVLSLDFNSLSSIDELRRGKKEELRFLITEDGRGDGIALAYTLFLDTDNSIDTFPETGTSWENAIYPIFSLSMLVKESWVTVHMEFDEVLHFKLSDPIESSYATTTDVHLLKCFNSSSYSKFYSEAAENFFELNSTTSLIVLDDCPFPQAGIFLLELNPSTELFVGNKSALDVLIQHEKVQSSEALKGQVDIIFYWPFASEGTMKDNIMEELQLCRKLLKKGGKIFPEFVHLQMLGIESETISKMTRVENANICGVDIAGVFNLLKTQHHLDIPIEGISYKPLTAVLRPMCLSLNDSKIIHTGKTISKDPTSAFLIVGEEVSSSFLPLQPVSDGRIDGFVYWFELNSGRSLPESEASSESEYDCGSEAAVVEMSSMKQELHSQKSNARRRFEHLFNSLSRDSPINQCVLLDEPVSVTHKQCLSFRFSVSDGRFSLSTEI